MPSLVTTTRAEQIAREVAVIHTRAKVDAQQGLAQLKHANQNETNAFIASRIVGRAGRVEGHVELQRVER